MAESDFPILFDRLKAILEPYAARMFVSTDAPGMYGLDLAPEATRKPAHLTRVDEDLIVELARLTARGYAATAGDPELGDRERLIQSAR